MTFPIDSKTVADRIVRSIRQICPDTSKFYGLHEPLFEGNEKKYVDECVETGWVSSVGKFVDRIENDLADFTGCGRAVAMVNGTAALQIALKIVGVESDTEVLCPALTFIATANAIVYNGAIPHFVDSEWSTLGMDPDALKIYLNDITELKNGLPYNRLTGRRISAMVPMHTFGHPVRIFELLQLSEQFKIPLVEDAAESLGSYVEGKHSGTFGKVACLSFNGNKTVTTGGGGALLTNDAALGALAKHLTTTAKRPHRWEFYHDMLGYNFRMPNLNAALGCAQLESLPNFLARKRLLAERYSSAFQEFAPEVEFRMEREGTTANYWLNVILLPENQMHQRDKVLAATNDAGLMTRPAWTLMNKLPMYAGAPSMPLTVAEQIEARLINIPSSTSLQA